MIRDMYGCVFQQIGGIIVENPVGLTKGPFFRGSYFSSFEKHPLL